MGDVKSDFSTSDEYQASYVITQAVNELCPAQIWTLRISVGGLPPAGTIGQKEDTPMIRPLLRTALTLTATTILAPTLTAPDAQADHDNNTLILNNSRLNDSLVQNVYTIQRQAGCTNDVNLNPQLNQAA